MLETLFLKSWRRASTGFDFTRAGPAQYPRALAKLLGFCATLALAFQVYALFPEYGGAFYQPFYSMLTPRRWRGGASSAGWGGSSRC